jgi:hypothetical protein
MSRLLYAKGNGHIITRTLHRKKVQRRSLLCTALDIMVVLMFLQRDVFGSDYYAFYGAVVNFQNVLDDSVVPPVFVARTCQ